MQVRFARALALRGTAFALLTLIGNAAPGAQAAAAAPTFSKDVVPILYKNCVTGHRAGEMAPTFTYQEGQRGARCSG